MKLPRNWMFIAALIAAAVFVVFFLGPREFFTTDGSPFQIEFAGGKCASVKSDPSRPFAGLNVDNTPIEMLPCGPRGDDRQWFTYNTGTKRIHWAAHPEKVVDVGSYANMSPVFIYTDKGNNQQWTFSDGIIANVGRPDVVMDVRDGQTVLQVYQKVSGAPNQKFSIKSTPVVPAAPAPMAPVGQPMGAAMMPNPMAPPPPGATTPTSMMGTPSPVPASPGSAQPTIVLPASTGPGTYLLRPVS